MLLIENQTEHFYAFHLREGGQMLPVVEEDDAQEFGALLPCELIEVLVGEVHAQECGYGVCMLVGADGEQLFGGGAEAEECGKAYEEGYVDVGDGPVFYGFEPAEGLVDIVEDLWGGRLLTQGGAEELCEEEGEGALDGMGGDGVGDVERACGGGFDECGAGVLFPTDFEECEGLEDGVGHGRLPSAVVDAHDETDGACGLGVGLYDEAVVGVFMRVQDQCRGGHRVRCRVRELRLLLRAGGQPPVWREL